MAEPTSQQVSSLLPIAYAYTGMPFVPGDNLGPPVPSAVLNASFSMPVNTVTDANRVEFATISASAAPNYPRSESIGGILMPVPTYKGTFFFDQSGGGSSQSFYAVEGAPGAPSTFASMLAAMKQLATARSRLSQTQVNVFTSNPLVFAAIRIDDVRTLRKGDTQPNPDLSLETYYQYFNEPNVGNENDQPDACYKAIFSDELGNSAQMYFHGVPIASQVREVGRQMEPRPRFEARLVRPDPEWLVNLNIFTNQLRSLGLGMRFTTTQWTPNGLPLVPAGPSTGNGTPIAITYGMAFTDPHSYSFQITPGAYQPIGKMRIILRGFKNLKVLNGRHPAVGFISGGNYWINVLRRAPDYTPWDGFGYLSPEVFNTFQPSPAPPVSQANFSGVSGVLYTSKKVGRPFGQARGRVSRRPT